MRTLGDMFLLSFLGCLMALFVGLGAFHMINEGYDYIGTLYIVNLALIILIYLEIKSKGENE